MSECRKEQGLSHVLECRRGRRMGKNVNAIAHRLPKASQSHRVTEKKKGKQENKINGAANRGAKNLWRGNSSRGSSHGFWRRPLRTSVPQPLGLFIRELERCLPTLEPITETDLSLISTQITCKYSSIHQHKYKLPASCTTCLATSSLSPIAILLSQILRPPTSQNSTGEHRPQTSPPSTMSSSTQP
jgi:hypothetical protein